MSPKPQLPKHAPKKTGKRGIGPAPEGEPLKVAKQGDLPGMEDKHLADLEDGARQYAAVRDQRMRLTEREVELKDALLSLMHKHKKTTYKCEDIEIRIVVTKEKVNVRILKDKEE